jgi:plasmid maintenance system antidote protein VapI
MTGISMEDLKGILLHVTVVTEDMALTLAKYTDMKDPDFWIDSKRHY